jgi:single-strand DNA-binding protein
MAYGYAQYTVLGRLAADADLAYTGEGTPYLKFRLLSNLGPKDHERVESTSCVMWGKRAESLAKHLTKGKAILVTGEPVTSSWEKDGAKHYRTEVKVDSLTFVGGGKPGNGDAGEPETTVDYE